jgi:RsiW-degrading membrane proteinase PrsW (M82 family)
MNVVVALVPVLLLLALLQLMDSFKLVRLTSVAVALVAGAAAAVLCLSLHDVIVTAGGIDLTLFARYVAPLTEEISKAVFVGLLLWRNRVGFLVDAAVQGFAVGTGFALVENVDYLRHLGDAGLTLWLVRGLGTAVLHGATTAVFSMVSKTVMDRRGNRSAAAFLPGLGLAAVIHSAFNHVPLPPLAMTALLLLVLPVVVIVVFQRSERATRDWVGAGLDLDLELLDLVRSEHFAFTRFGQYLQELRARFGGPVVADMFCLLRLELELSVQAKAMLMAREAGVDIPVTDDLHTSLQEIGYLQASIGPTGLLALKPLQVTSARDQWHRYLLAASGSRARLTHAARARLLRAAGRRQGGEGR